MNFFDSLSQLRNRVSQLSARADRPRLAGSASVGRREGSLSLRLGGVFAEAKTKDWDLSLPSKCRAAFYCKESELSQVYEGHFQGANLSWDDFNAYCIDKNHKYRKAEGVDWLGIKETIISCIVSHQT